MDEEILNTAIWIAGANWMLWRADFEHQGAVTQIPVLIDPQRFGRFRKEYSLLKFRTDEFCEQLRTELCDADEFGQAVVDPTGAELEELASTLSQNYAAANLGMQRSFLSKLAAFANPAIFAPWDRFARLGLGFQLNNQMTYPQYLNAVNEFANGPEGTEISGRLDEIDAYPTDNQDGFQRRVMDVYLMIRGGRWADQIVQA